MTISVSWFRIRSPLSCLPILSQSSSMLLMRMSTVGQWLACLSVCLPVYQSVSLSASQSVCVSACLPFRLCISQSVRLCIGLSASQSVYQSVCLCQSVRLCIGLSASQSVSISLSVCVSACLPVSLSLSVSQSVYVSVCLSVSQSVCLSPPHSGSYSRVPSLSMCLCVYQSHSQSVYLLPTAAPIPESPVATQLLDAIKAKEDFKHLSSTLDTLVSVVPDLETNRDSQSVSLDPYTDNPFILGTLHFSKITSTSSLAVFNFSIFNHATCTSIILWYFVTLHEQSRA